MKNLKITRSRITSLAMAFVFLVSSVAIIVHTTQVSDPGTTDWIRDALNSGDPFLFMADTYQLTPPGEAVTPNSGTYETVASGAYTGNEPTQVPVPETQYILKYKPGQEDSFKRLAGQYIETDVDLGGDIHAITLKEAALPSSLAPELKEAGAGRSIAYIQTDSKLSLLGAETAPSGQATATTQWEDASMPKGGAVLVALLDTGVDVAHPALEGWMTEGYNATNDTHVIHDSSRPWMEAHGTHVAGLIADTAYTYGAPVKILPVQVFADGEARVSDVLKALAYAKIQEAAIGNLSFGTSESSPALYEALRDSDMLFVCAAGNHHRDTNETPSYPAAYDLPNVLSVTSVNRDGGLSYFSDYGHVDLAAPGRGIVSALPGGNRGAMTGTSLSAGLVSGAAAVVSAHGAYTAAELKQRLLGTADRLDNLQDKVPGGRRLNVDNALSGRPGQILMLHPKEDFDASGYSDTPETRLHLYAQSGAVVQAAAGATHTLILKEDQIQT